MNSVEPAQHQAIIITAPGGPEVLQIAMREVPEPGPEDVLIEVRAAGINRHDCNQRRAGPRHGRSDVPGLEVAGIIKKVGANISRSRIGEPVCALTDGGGYAEFAVAPDALALPIPAGFDFIIAAGLPEALFTTWYNIFYIARLMPGEQVLIHGGTSGVGSLAIQALTALNYTVFATCGDEEKRRAASRFGATCAFNYHSETLAAEILNANSGKFVDVILDMSAGAHIDTDLEILASKGRIAHLSGGSKPLVVPLAKLMAKQGWITGSLLRLAPLADKIMIADRLRNEIWPKLGPALKPVVAATFPVAQAAAAHRKMETSHIGKIILTNDPIARP